MTVPELTWMLIANEEQAGVMNFGANTDAGESYLVAWHKEAGTNGYRWDLTAETDDGVEHLGWFEKSEDAKLRAERH